MIFEVGSRNSEGIEEEEKRFNVSNWRSRGTIWRRGNNWTKEDT